jgi:hypothetical protein
MVLDKFIFDSHNAFVVGTKYWTWSSFANECLGSRLSSYGLRQCVYNDCVFFSFDEW